jgi:serine/threonine protein kinase/class 3 adenylate cyclase
MICAGCGHTNPGDAKFCENCAADLVRVCPSCATQNSPSARFCKQCRASLTGEVAATAGTAPAPVAAPLPSSFASGRYQVRKFLGEGGRKRVYLAHDQKLDRDVAFAVIKTEGLDVDGLARVQREAQAMGRLGDHPNIVNVFDTGDEDAQPYIVSQYMAGGDLAAVLQARDDHRLPIEQAVRIAEQVCAGLEHAHARGIVHRDLKPGNIWFDSPGVAQIGDFGLAVALDRSRLTIAGMMVGTASYMPPEQAMGGETTPASDLYALGCVLYEMVTGRPPFVGDDTVAVISQHVNTPPVAPTWHNAECPPALETLILRMLEKDAKKRPASAAQVLEALVLFSSGPMAPAQPGALPSQADQANPIYRRTFVGREQEVKQLEKAFDAALSGQGSLLMIVGEPGIGKTTITEQLATYVGMRGGTSLVGHCYEEGSLSLPYLPFVEAMRSYVVKQDREQLSQQLGSGAADVARIVSEVRDRVAVETAASSSPEEERFRLFQAVAGFLRNASGAQALCVVLEDLHDADKGTMEMLVHLARNLSGARILLVGTYRDVEVDRTHPLSPALAELRRVESFQRIPLRGLSPDEVQRMLSNIAGQEVQYVLAEAVYRQTEGNPLFIQEVIRYAAESGLIKREGDQWVATTDSLITQIPEGLKDVIGRRLSGLSDDCNRVLSVASVIGRDFAVDVLQRVGGLSEDELLNALEEAMRVSLIEEMKGGRELRYRFTHAFFRQTLYEEMIAPRRLRMHNEVAKALEQHYAGRVEDHAAELAEHYAHSSSEGDLQLAVAYGELAAARAASVYAFGEAARLIEQAIQVQEIVEPNDAETLYRLVLTLSACLLAAGEAERVINETLKRGLELAEKLGGGKLACDIAEVAGNAMVYQHGLVAFLMPEYAALCDVMDRHAAPGTGEAARALVWRSWIAYVGKDPKATWPPRRKAMELARMLGDRETLVLTSFAFTVTGNPIGWDADKLAVAREIATLTGAFESYASGGLASLGAGLPLAFVGQMLWSVADVLCDGGEIDLAKRVWAELDAYADRVEDPYVRSWQIFSMTTRASFTGDLEGCIDAGINLEQRADALGIPAWGRLVGTWCTGGGRLYTGRMEEFLDRQWAFEALPYGEANNAFIQMVNGRVDEARATVGKYMERLRSEDDEWGDRIGLMYILDVALRLEDRELVAALRARLQDMLPYSNNNFQQTRGRILGRAAMLLDDPAAARAHFDDGLLWARKIGIRPEIALLRFELARLLFEHYPDERAAAVEHLNTATREAQAMKMKPLLDDCLALKLKFQGITSTDFNTSIDTVARAVRDEKPDLRTHAAPDGTVTLMFSDIEDSTVLTESLGDQAWQELLRRHNALIRDQIRAHDGFEVKTMGDGFMVAFQSAKKGLDCAIAIQRAFAEHNAESQPEAAVPHQHVKVRIGLHAGEAIKEGDDFYGKNVIMASRVAGKANGGEILVSSLLRSLVESSVDGSMFSKPREVELKGLSGTHAVYDVAWATNEA